MIGLKIIDKLWSLSDSYWFKHSQETWLVDGKIIATVDLSVIRLKLEHHLYKEPMELTSEVKSMWLACVQNYGREHELTRTAEVLFQKYIKMAGEYDLGSY